MATEEKQINEISENMAGRWRETRSENLDDFNRELGLNFFWRKIACQIRPEMEILVDGADIGVNLKTVARTEVFQYKLNGEVEIERDNGKFTIATTYKDGKLTTRQEPVPGNEAKMLVTVREVNETGELVTTNLIGGVTCKRFFSKLQ